MATTTDERSLAERVEALEDNHDKSAMECAELESLREQLAAQEVARQRMIDAVMEAHEEEGHQLDADVSPPAPDGRYLMVEKSTHDCTIYVYTADSVDVLGQAHWNQEFREDWYVYEVVDLDTGGRFSMEPAGWELHGAYGDPYEAEEG